MARSIDASIKIVSFNIQAGVRADRYGDYLTKSWQHIFPHAEKAQNLSLIAAAVAPFDVVCLQEADGGSMRSGLVHQSRYIAAVAQFPSVLDQRNRQVGFKALPFANSGNAILSRIAPSTWAQHRLPGAGRGALEATFDLLAATHAQPASQCRIFNLHLALTPAAQQAQLAFLAAEISRWPHALIVTGDFNCTPDSLALQSFLHQTGLQLVDTAPSFPSWAPKRRIDLIAYRGMALKASWMLPMLASDHLGVAAEFLQPHNHGDG
jgi:endonuclease/exonuclease/phosphatase family metal-dependent hydrolase